MRWPQVLRWDPCPALPYPSLSRAWGRDVRGEGVEGPRKAQGHLWGQLLASAREMGNVPMGQSCSPS